MELFNNSLTSIFHLAFFFFFLDSFFKLLLNKKTNLMYGVMLLSVIVREHLQFVKLSMLQCQSSSWHYFQIHKN